MPGSSTTTSTTRSRRRCLVTSRPKPDGTPRRTCVAKASPLARADTATPRPPTSTTVREPSTAPSSATTAAQRSASGPTTPKPPHVECKPWAHDPPLGRGIRHRRSPSNSPSGALGHTVHPGERNARCGALTTNGALRHLRQATTWGVGGLWCRRRSPAGASTGPDESGPPTPHLSRVPVQLELPISHARFVATISIKESSILAARVVLAPYGTCVISSFPTFALNAMSRACCIVK